MLSSTILHPALLLSPSSSLAGAESWCLARGGLQLEGKAIKYNWRRKSHRHKHLDPPRGAGGTMAPTLTTHPLPGFTPPQCPALLLAGGETGGVSPSQSAPPSLDSTHPSSRKRAETRAPRPPRGMCERGAGPRLSVRRGTHAAARCEGALPPPAPRPSASPQTDGNCSPGPGATQPPHAHADYHSRHASRPTAQSRRALLRGCGTRGGPVQDGGRQ